MWLVLKSYIWITRAAKHSSGAAQEWLDPYSHKNKVANMETKDRKPPLDKTFGLILSVKKQKEVENN